MIGVISTGKNMSCAVKFGKRLEIDFRGWIFFYPSMFIQLLYWTRYFNIFNPELFL